MPVVLVDTSLTTSLPTTRRQSLATDPLTAKEVVENELDLLALTAVQAMEREQQLSDLKKDLYQLVPPGPGGPPPPEQG